MLIALNYGFFLFAGVLLGVGIVAHDLKHPASRQVLGAGCVILTLAVSMAVLG